MHRLAGRLAPAKRGADPGVSVTIVLAMRASLYPLLRATWQISGALLADKGTCVSFCRSSGATSYRDIDEEDARCGRRAPLISSKYGQIGLAIIAAPHPAAAARAFAIAGNTHRRGHQDRAA